MRSRWSDTEASSLSSFDLLVYTSRLIGAEPSLVLWGGGNTSLKVTEPDLRGRAIQVLRVKDSGSDLKGVTKRDFAGVRMDDILHLLQREEMNDQEMVDYLTRALQEPGGSRPSIETLLHGFLPFAVVIHTHADAIVSLTNTNRCEDLLREVFGPDVVAIPYRRPSFHLSKAVARALEAQPEAKAVILEKHGTINWGATFKEAYLTTIDLITRAEEAIAARSHGRRRFGDPRVAPLSRETRRKIAASVAPVLRGLVSRQRRAILHFDDSPEVLDFVGSAEAATLSQVGPATPDHTIYTKRLPCFVTVDRPGDPDRLTSAVQSAVERFAADYRRYFETHRFEGAVPLDPSPRVVLIPGLGMFTTGKDKRAALIVDGIYRHTIGVLGGASAVGRYVSLTPREAFDIEYWPLEHYRLSLAPPEKQLARRVALVTGGAGGIGRAVAHRLASEDAHVVIGDLDEAGARKVAEEIIHANGGDRALGLELDVTRETSVRRAVEEALLAYGGLDIVVSNAGVAHAAPLDRMELADWEQSFAVNATGHFLVSREALRVLKRQGLGGSFVFIGTKNVMSPGKDFGAYSASKAAEAQLAKLVALEGGPDRIRSNIVSPDAVFRDSKLWSEEVRRERAQAQGIPVEQLEAFYQKRNILAVSVFPEDVAEAVCYLASDRSAKTTGCTLTVDGGLKDAFPR
ncbi:MAG: bifunctional rhamnulose-1-phosphate aldolase/short-chain dehydrogenase [Candidatus Methylomirabilia bacterium]